MSERVYAWLLRLYPARFRETYGEDALQLFKDRFRDERGLVRRLRLWVDLLGDFAISLPAEYRRAQPAALGTAVQQRVDGVPSFYLLEDEKPGTGALLGGVLLLSMMIAALPAVNSFGGSHSSIQAWFRQAPTSAVRRGGMGGAAPNLTARSVTFDASERRRVVDEAVSNLKKSYPDADVARKMADALLAHESAGDDDGVNGEALAELLTRQMREVSHDRHLELTFSLEAIPDRPPVQTPERFALYRKAMGESNCTFEKVEMLPHNIGYLKLNSFPEPSICRQTAVNAMASLNEADAVVFDLRDNTGGFPEMVSLMAAYLFDHPEYMYNPRESPSVSSWTRSPVLGNKLADKPVYVLTSGSTFSGAEQFSYDLKMLKRATLVGERTRGGAHAGVWHRIDDHFGIGIPEVRAVNPFSTIDWDGVGVEPDVAVKAADALKTAEKLAIAKTVRVARR